MLRVVLGFLSLIGLYPQYRAMKTILIGLGWVSGDWEEEHRVNRVKIYVIEPIMESLLQVIFVQNKRICVFLSGLIIWFTKMKM